MMEQCKKCCIYSEDYDAMLREMDDYTWDNAPRHFCYRYTDGIPIDVEEDKDVCPSFVEPIE